MFSAGVPPPGGRRRAQEMRTGGWWCWWCGEGWRGGARGRRTVRRRQPRAIPRFIDLREGKPRRFRPAAKNRPRTDPRAENTRPSPAARLFQRHDSSRYIPPNCRKERITVATREKGTAEGEESRRNKQALRLLVIFMFLRFVPVPG